ncbi:MAG: hypothetical protein WDM85_05285 [Caulobacteraceae bacterium]
MAGILYYLARRFPEARLMPHGDPEAEARVVALDVVRRFHHPSRAAAGGWSTR